MNNKIILKKMGFRTMFPNVASFYKVLDKNRQRLEPWFWWTGKNVTPNLSKTLVFMTLYILDTKRKKLMHKFSKTNQYDEQFLVFNNDKFAGMTGLDNIDVCDKKAEVWYFITEEFEGKGIMSAGIKILEDYSFNNKGMDLLYVKTADGNKRSENILKRNGYNVEKIEFGVPVSRRNPKITNLTTWQKVK